MLGHKPFSFSLIKLKFIHKSRQVYPVWGKLKWPATCISYCLVNADLCAFWWLKFDCWLSFIQHLSFLSTANYKRSSESHPELHSAASCSWGGQAGIASWTLKEQTGDYRRQECSGLGRVTVPQDQGRSTGSGGETPGVERRGGCIHVCSVNLCPIIKFCVY